MTTKASLQEEPEWVREALAWPFDFSVSGYDSAHLLVGISVPAEADLEVLAAGPADGAFFLHRSPQSSLPVVTFVSSEGQSGVIARTVPECLALILSAPYWLDLVKFSGGGSLSEMRRALPYLHRELLEDTPETLDLGRTLLQHFQLQPLVDPAATLHECLHSFAHSHLVLGTDGRRFEPLFCGFTVDSNPMWRVPPT